MSLCLVNIHGDIEGDYDIIKDLPRNATNGDVIKTMFPNAVIEAVYEPFYSADVIKVDFYGGGKYFTTFDRDWWNAPYERR